jgi:peptidylprolyl isomerase
MRTKLICLAAVLVLGVGASACGGDDDEQSAAATPEATETAAPPDSGGGVDAIAAGISKDTKTKPEIPAPSGDPPTELVIKDIVKGKGPKAQAGDQLTMQYVGNSWSTGEQFDASWDSGQPFPFQLGGGQVIPGWDQGMVGMKEGGRRLLVIPPDLGYGPSGAGPIGPNETLIFVVDLVKLN